MWKVVESGGIGISVLVRVYKAPYRSNTPLGPEIEERRPYGYIWIWVYGWLPRGLPLSQVAGNHGSLAMINPTPTPTPNHLDHAAVRVEQAGGDRARAAAALGSRATAITTHARAGLLVLGLGLGSGLELVLGLRLGLWCPGWS